MKLGYRFLVSICFIFGAGIAYKLIDRSIKRDEELCRACHQKNEKIRDEYFHAGWNAHEKMMKDLGYMEEP